MRVYVAKKEILDNLLDTNSAGLNSTRPAKIDLAKVLKDIMRSANEFVPSESGSILLNNNMLINNKKRKGAETLQFVASFGKGSSRLTNISIPAGVGIAGQTYLQGKPYISENVAKDKNFYSEIYKTTKFETKSIISVPIEFKNKTIGVIELINKLDNVNFMPRDLTLLNIFASYTSTLIQNALNAKRYQDFSTCDSLTGVYNDRHFFEIIPAEAKRAIKSKKELFLLFVDIDNLKSINDTHGHLAGNRVLSQIGKLLSETKPTRKTTIARYGGDEFVVLIPDISMEKTTKYASLLRKKIEETTYLRQRDLKNSAVDIPKTIVTASIGIASLRENVGKKMKLDNTIKSLIQQADVAMYRSKSTGKNKVSIAEGRLSL